MDVDASGSGILHRQGRLRLGSQGVGRSTRGGIWAFGHGNLKEKKKGQTRGGQEGEKGYAVSQTGSGTAGSKTRRPCRQRSSRRLPDHTESRARSTKGLAGHGPPLHVMIAHVQGNAQSSFQMHRCRGSEERLKVLTRRRFGSNGSGGLRETFGSLTGFLFTRGFETMSETHGRRRVTNPGSWRSDFSHSARTIPQVRGRP